jgi:glutathione S-transferase
MNDDRRLVLVGGYSSPYSRKMRAVLRYRGIPHRWLLKGTPEAANLPKPKRDLIPVVVFPDAPDEAHIDSTPLIRRLERDHPERSVIPPDPAVAWFDALIEDYADEWLTKAMFHFRWAYPSSAAKADRVTVLEHYPEVQGADLTELAEAFSRRQIARLDVVGSNQTTAPVIEASYRRLLELLDELLARAPFVMGRRPGSSDFGLFGQLSQLVLFDPSSVEIAVELAPRVIAWVHRVEDLSWLEVGDDDWIDRDDAAARLLPLLFEIGRVYVPFLVANGTAVGQDLDRTECEIDGTRWTQRPFRYQAKCLTWLREGFASLDADDRSWVEQTLAGTGCEVLFE